MQLTASLGFSPPPAAARKAVGAGRSERWPVSSARNASYSASAAPGRCCASLPGRSRCDSGVHATGHGPHATGPHATGHGHGPHAKCNGAACNRTWAACNMQRGRMQQDMDMGRMQNATGPHATGHGPHATCNGAACSMQHSPAVLCGTLWGTAALTGRQRPCSRVKHEMSRRSARTPRCSKQTKNQTSERAKEQTTHGGDTTGTGIIAQARTGCLLDPTMSSAARR